MSTPRNMPNVLLLLVDAMRADRLHCYGNKWQTSPAMDRIAAEGVLFENVISHASHTLPAVASILTGLDPMSHGLTDPRTHMNHDWGDKPTPLQQLERDGLTVAGFNTFLYYHFGREVNIENVGEALPFIEAHRDKPFFLWQFNETVHLPYDPPAPYDTAFLPEGYKPSAGTAERADIVRKTMIVHPPGRISQFEKDQADGNTGGFEADLDRDIEYERSAATVSFQPEDRIAIAGLYDGEVRTVDDEIDQYLRKLDELGILDDTIVIISSDHGEELLERGNVGHSSCSLAGSLYDEAIHVPLIIRYPRKLPRGKRISTQVSHIDLMPTIYDLLGLTMPIEVDGRSLVGLINGDEANRVEQTFAVTLPCGWQSMADDFRQIWCIRTPNWKLVFNDFEPREPSSYELYDMQADPGETSNIVEQHNDVVEELKEKLHTWINKKDH